METLTHRAGRTPDQLVRPVVRSIEPYEWEESNEALARRFGLDPRDVLRFDMNTAPAPPAALDEALAHVGRERRINEYFDPHYAQLTEAIAAYNGVSTSNILIGAGADEVVAVIVAAFIEPGDLTAMLLPTFPMCRLYTEQHGGTVAAVPYDEGFQGPLNALIEAAQEAQLVFLCNPNNPSGTAFTLAEVERLVAAAPGGVIVDEAYFEYHGQTALPLIERYPNLIVVRTFSKAFGMAGARVGYCLAAPAMIALLNRLRPPNSVTYMSALLAEAMLGQLADVQAAAAATVLQREALRGSLQGLGLHVWPSRGNFLLARLGGADGARRAEGVHQALLRRGLVLRGYRGHLRLGDCLRMTVRTPADNARLLAELGTALADHD